MNIKKMTLKRQLVYYLQARPFLRLLGQEELMLMWEKKQEKLFRGIAYIFTELFQQFQQKCAGESF